ncbi:protein tyrosine kinase [Nocardia sp. NEAU-351]|uniref:Protein tyrosine kinase n=2 Tax=Nocardia bovistercoris TaxID=2785916 RepID=A0A931I6E3_9NOCA|nr:protein tyrosine kinase [Nocardia bovistercoris]
MGLADYLRIARRRWVVLVAGLVLGVALAGYQIQSTTETYSASSTMYVSMATGTSVADSYQGGLAAQQRVRSYMELVSSDSVVDRVIGQLSLKMSRDDLRAKISADAPPATTLLRVTVTDTQAERARVLADEVVSQFRALVDDLETIERSAAPAARVAVVDRAERPREPSGPGTSKILAAGILAGLLLGAAAAYVWERLDRKVRTTDELEPLGAVLGSVTLGTDDQLDELRALRSRLPDKAKSVLVAATDRGYAPDLSAGLADSIAATGGKVLLIDTETVLVISAEIAREAAASPSVGSSGVDIDWPVRNGTVSGSAEAESLFENAAQRTTVLDTRKIPATPPVEDKASGPDQGGLAAVLRGETTLEDAVLAPGERSYARLALGDADLRTPDLLASVRFDAVLVEAAARYDRVLVGAYGTDALALASKCDATVAVVALPAPNPERVGATRDALTAAGATLTGFVTVAAPRRWRRRSGDRR